MILTLLQGRLGNQLFQVFVTIAAAIETNQSFAFYSKPKDNECVYWDTVFRPLRQNVIYTKIKHHMLYEQHVTQCFDYFPFFNKLTGCKGKMCLLVGWFQHLNYLKLHFDTIVDMLQLRQLQDQIFKIRAPQMPYITDWGTTVSMHFRLGDFLSNQHKNKFPVMPPQYYLDALQAVCSQTDQSLLQVIYFCELTDLPLVLPVITELEHRFPRCQFYKVIDGLKDWEEMLLMSCCQHHIIANSTFSFWGAYLGKQYGVQPKQVCYPSLWLTDDLPRHLNDSFPDTWTRIEVL